MEVAQLLFAVILAQTILDIAPLWALGKNRTAWAENRNPGLRVQCRALNCPLD